MVAPTPAPLTHVDVPKPHEAYRHVAPVATEHPINVGQLERAASVLIGSLLVANGIKRFSLVGLGIAGLGAALIQRGSTGRCPGYAALDVTTAEDAAGGAINKLLSNPLNQHIHVEQAITVYKPLEEVYRYWRHLENLPLFMENLESVKEVDDKQSHWIARGIRGKKMEWHATIVQEEPNHLLAWKSAENADVPNAGQVLFETLPNDRGTQVRVVLTYDPPAGILGALVAKITGNDPASQMKEDLRRFKEIMEAGENPTTEGQPQGTCS